MFRDDFAIFILTHGRANNIDTDKLLRRRGYSGEIYYLIDNEDSQAEEYYKNFGHDNVIMFDKIEIAKHIDAVDNFHNRCAILYARHAVFDVAKNLGLTYFQMFDDDVYSLAWKSPRTDGVLGSIEVKDYDSVLNVLIKLLDDTKALSVALAQGGDFIGGVGNNKCRRMYERKCMNTFICRADSPIDFKGTMNEDVAAYTHYGMTGRLMLTVNCISVAMRPTQRNDGGMADYYLETGTYIKSAYSLITSPSCCKIAYMEDNSRGGNRGGRIHHNVIHKNAYVEIVPESLKK